MEEKELQQIFLDLLGWELTGKEPEQTLKDRLTPPVIAALYRLSKSHDMAHMVSSALGKWELLGEDEISAKFQKQEMLSVYRTQRLEYEFGRICGILDEAEIAYIPLKGSVIRPYYPTPSMRTSCDIDILVHESDLDTAADLLVTHLGYEKGRKWDHDLAMDTPNGMHLELHYTLIENDKRIDDNLLRVWDYTVKREGHRYDMTPAFFLFYQIAHAAKHFSIGGCGIRPFMDLWIMEHRMHISRDCADELLNNSKMSTFAKACHALTDVWFGEAKHTDLTHEMQDYLMNAGVYGSTENAIAAEQNKGRSKFNILMSMVFLKYKNMCSFYPVLKKCPLLLPFCHIHRWCRILFKKGNARKALHKIEINNTISNKRRDVVGILYKKLDL